MDIFNVLTLFGGLAMFLYGMRLMGTSLKEGSSGTLKSAIEKVTNNAVKAFLVGLSMTAIIQSSTATIVITSGLVGAGILTLHQSLGIIIGANVGTTVTGQIIRLLDVDAAGTMWLQFLKPSTLAPIALIAGIIILMSGRLKNSDIIGNIMMGFGILFSGLLSMTSAVSVLSDTGVFEKVFSHLSSNPLLGYLTGVTVAFILQSSSATIGILQAFSVSGDLTFSSIYAVIAGIYLGDCVTTAIVCSIGSTTEAKRVGIVHILFNLSETVLVFAGVWAARSFGLLDGLWNASVNSGTIANTNTIFNLSCAVLLFPMLNVYEQMSRKIVKDKPKTPWKYQDLVEALNPAFFNTPALAFHSCNNGLRTMLNLSINSINNSIGMLTIYDEEMYSQIKEDEDSIDQLADHISHYLVQMSPHLQSEDYIRIFDEYSQAVTEFERMGDHAMNIAQYAKTMNSNGYSISPEGQGELRVMAGLISRVLDATQKAFEEKDLKMARLVEPLEEVVDDLGNAMKEHHLQRLRSGRCNVYTGAVFLDLLIDLERISDDCSNVAIAMISRMEKDVIHAHDYIQGLHQGRDAYFNAKYHQLWDYYFKLLEDAGKEIPAADE